MQESNFINQDSRFKKNETPMSDYEISQILMNESRMLFEDQQNDMKVYWRLSFALWAALIAAFFQVRYMLAQNPAIAVGVLFGHGVIILIYLLQYVKTRRYIKILGNLLEDRYLKYITSRDSAERIRIARVKSMKWGGMSGSDWLVQFNQFVFPFLITFFITWLIFWSNW